MKEKAKCSYCAHFLNKNFENWCINPNNNKTSISSEGEIIKIALKIKSIYDVCNFYIPYKYAHLPTLLTNAVEIPFVYLFYTNSNELVVVSKHRWERVDDSGKVKTLYSQKENEIYLIKYFTRELE